MKKKYDLLIPTIIFAILSLPVLLTWYKGNSIIMAGDSGWPPIFKYFFYNAIHVWDASVNFGYSAPRQLPFLIPYLSYGYFLEILGFSGHTIQMLMFYISVFFSGFGFYLLTKKLNFSELTAIFAGIFYAVNPQVMDTIWVFAYGISFFFYCYLPIMLFLFLSFLDSNKILDKAKFMLFGTLTLFSSNFANPAFIVVYFFIGSS